MNKMNKTKRNLKTKLSNKKCKPEISTSQSNLKLNQTMKETKVKAKKLKVQHPVETDNFYDGSDDASLDNHIDDNDISSSDEDMTEEKFKKGLENLEKIDPEFNKYLEENDNSIFDFNKSESELEDNDNDEANHDIESESEDSEKNDDDDDDDNTDNEERYHKPTRTLEIASDESDFEEEEGINVKGKLTIQLVNALEQSLQANKRTIRPISATVRAFHACLVRVSEEDSLAKNDLRVDESSVFNAVIRLCVTSLYPCLKQYLTLPDSSVMKDDVIKSARWKRAKNTIRSYIIDLVKIMDRVTSEDILTVLLKHLHQMIPFVACLPTLSKNFLRRLVSLWSSHSDDRVRVISFLCILKYVVCDTNAYLEPVLKSMYISYVKNCKFVSQNTISAINFMRKSLAEVYSLNDTLTYNHAFLYIRQLAIHLRSAVQLKKKDSIQGVYNWQFVTSLQLWVDVICNNYKKPQINALLYPIIQVVIGCMKLVPTAQYFPLRFHCIHMLIQITKKTTTFVPVLPSIIEAFEILNVNAKHKKITMKPIDFSYILRLSKSQLQENGFKDGVIENIYDCLLEYAAYESYRISFPDIVVLLLIQMKQFLKNCKNPNYSKKLKPLIDKISEVSKMVELERLKSGISLSDAMAINAWENEMKLKSNSLMKFYETWSKMKKQKNARKVTDKIMLDDYELPSIKKSVGKHKEKKEMLKTKDGKILLFDSNSDSECEIKFTDKTSDTNVELDTENTTIFNNSNDKVDKQKTCKRKAKNSKAAVLTKKKKTKEFYDNGGEEDIVTDLKLEEFLS